MFNSTFRCLRNHQHPAWAFRTSSDLARQGYLAIDACPSARYQIIYRLWTGGVKKRILFLADRNALIDQTKRGDFRHFRDKMTVIKNHQVDKSYEIYLALYQGLSGSDPEQDIFKNFSKDFFDLVVVDECHRGSAREDSAWRRILEYYSNATHIGLTATPKETTDVSNIEYFGEPIYTYSLRQGINDGFLAPYRVIRVGLNIDLEGWRPPTGYLDKNGNPVEDRIYNRTDCDCSRQASPELSSTSNTRTESVKFIIPSDSFRTPNPNMDVPGFVTPGRGRWTVKSGPGS